LILWAPTSTKISANELVPSALFTELDELFRDSSFDNTVRRSSMRGDLSTGSSGAGGAILGATVEWPRRVELSHSVTRDPMAALGTFSTLAERLPLIGDCVDH
jgi:hypothetical protein